jgi:chromosome segregation ATPase
MDQLRSDFKQEISHIKAEMINNKNDIALLFHRTAIKDIELKDLTDQIELNGKKIEGMSNELDELRIKIDTNEDEIEGNGDHIEGNIVALESNSDQIEKNKEGMEMNKNRIENYRKILLNHINF